jgi:hypothetical protein
MRKIGSILVAGTILFGLVGSAHAGSAVQVFEDPADDAGVTDQGVAVPVATAAGFDLTGGSIAKSGKDLDFTVTHAAMPDGGSVGEGFRLLWHINSGGNEYRFTVKSLDVGKPDVIAGDGQDRLGQVYQGVARLEECVDEALPAVLTLVNCRVTEIYEASFDPGAGTVTWKVPMASIKAKTGTLIGGGSTGASNTNCQICWVPHYAERSLTPRTVIDAATQTIAYKVPKK